jgi:hypothetical protein
MIDTSSSALPGYLSPGRKTKSRLYFESSPWTRLKFLSSDCPSIFWIRRDELILAYFVLFFSFQKGGKKSSLLQKVNHPLAKFSTSPLYIYLLLPPFGMAKISLSNTNVKKTVAVSRQEPARRLLA